jgi:hypothetical protein
MGQGAAGTGASAGAGAGRHAATGGATQVATALGAGVEVVVVVAGGVSVLAQPASPSAAINGITCRNAPDGHLRQRANQHAKIGSVMRVVAA